MNKKMISKILVGAIIYVIGINIFLTPVGLFTTGLMGISQEFAATINIIFNINLTQNDSTFLLIQTLTYWIMNLPIIILGFKKIGRKFTLKTLIISFFVIPFFINVISIDHSLILDNGNVTLAAEMLSAITGSILIGAGMGLIISSGACIGGTDILAIYMSVFKGKSFGSLNLAINMIVVVWSLLLTHDITTGVMILLTLFIQSYIVDMVYNYNSKTTLLIFTKKAELVGEYILEQGRTYNVLDSKTGFTKENNNLIITIVNKDEIKDFKYGIKQCDPFAFVDLIVTDSIEGNFQNTYLRGL